jgi:hypothetical protein
MQHGMIRGYGGLHMSIGMAEYSTNQLLATNAQQFRDSRCNRTPDSRQPLPYSIAMSPPMGRDSDPNEILMIAGKNRPAS